MDLEKIPRFPISIEGYTFHVGTANELSAALDVLQGQHDRIVLEQLGPHLADIIGDSAGLMATLRSLSQPDQLYLVKTIGGRLAGIVQTARRMSNIFAMLSSAEVENQFLATLGHDGLHYLVKNAQDLSDTLEWLYGKSDTKVLKLFGSDRLKQIIRSGADLSLVLNMLDAASGQRVLMDLLGWDHVVELIRNGNELAQTLRATPSQIGTHLIATMSQEQLIHIIGNEQDWAYLWERLEPAEARAIAKKLNIKDYAA